MSDKLIEEIERVARHHVGVWVKEQHPDLKNLFVAAEQDIRDLAKAVAALLSPARDEALEEAAQRADSWTKPDVVKLAAGEMTAQELRTAIAVAKGIAAAIRARKSAPAPQTSADRSTGEAQ